MQNVAIVIPAQENNKYYTLGDLEAFGDTSLLQWKISQCKEFLPDNQIYVVSSSSQIEFIVKQENVKFISRDENCSYENMLELVAKEICEKNIIWTSATSPFLSGNLYKKMYKTFIKSVNYDSLIAVLKKYEYAYFNQKPINFIPNKYISRHNIAPIEIVTSGCHIFSTDMLLRHKSLFGDKPYLFPLNILESTEIKDVTDLTIANNLISIYFKTEVLV